MDLHVGLCISIASCIETELNYATGLAFGGVYEQHGRMLFMTISVWGFAGESQKQMIFSFVFEYILSSSCSQFILVLSLFSSSFLFWVISISFFLFSFLFALCVLCFVFSSFHSGLFGLLLLSLKVY
jgi:hypothetical protein